MIRHTGTAHTGYLVVGWTSASRKITVMFMFTCECRITSVGARAIEDTLAKHPAITIPDTPLWNVMAREGLLHLDLRHAPHDNESAGKVASELIKLSCLTGLDIVMEYHDVDESDPDDPDLGEVKYTPPIPAELIHRINKHLDRLTANV